MADDDQFQALLDAGLLADTVHCMCEIADHHPGGAKNCSRVAKLQLRIHLVHVCRHPDILATAKVDADGCTTQLACIECFQHLQVMANAKIAQTRARCTTLSTSCQRCGNGLALRAPDQPGGIVLLRECPNCGTERMHFAPVCGAGVKDRDGNSHGCGQKLEDHHDVIRGVIWLDGE